MRGNYGLTRFQTSTATLIKLIFVFIRKEQNSEAFMKIMAAVHKGKARKVQL